MENVYGKLAAWVYHLDKPIGHSFGDLEYYRERLAGCTGAILEPATGNGRILIPLLESGLNIEGFDASEEMLHYCRQECLQRNLTPVLTRQTFGDFTAPRCYEAIIMPAGSFQLITNTASALALLQRCYDNLLPGGRLILDIDNSKEIIRSRSTLRSWKASDDECLTLSSSDPEINYVQQTTLTYLRYEHWQNGILTSTELDLFCLRWWGIYELTFALRAAGFTDVIVSGDYQHGRAADNDDAIISFEARRP
ncbi:MAG: SAM-dependent methyltransferase [Thalassobium sp.]|uniref:Class I SAM-dependent methyltransferase n=1 Tax=Thalassolituus pacificus TaxID=2975440 RepID=A0A9X3ASG2_9GAMM|nr:class I SAM-dependent methyltransferase [Thalassolituus pacificus]MCT7359944.1 class I SAM-dependent methyltransferase [Thalassolituus pacificus]PHS62688.1 MAG: SAM-dependent methyltransferase [Thalassobium sp.]